MNINLGDLINSQLNLNENNVPDEDIEFYDIDSDVEEDYKNDLYMYNKNRNSFLIASLEHFYEIVLSWNVHMRGSYPPNIRQEDLESIPDVFESALQYRKIFEKLLLVECWSQFITSLEELNLKNDSFPVYIDNVEIKDFNKDRRDASIQEHEILLTGSSKYCEGKFLVNDVLVLYQGDNMYSLEDSILVRVLETPTQSFFQSNKINATFNKEHEVSFKCSGFLPENSRFFNVNTSWRCIKLFTLITLRREFLVMELIIKSPLRKSIFNPTIEKNYSNRPDYIEKVIKDYELNKSQAEAVDLVMQKNNGFSLIQGPPGTGKTKTVLVLINEILKKLSYSESSPKILVCTPSNAACDEIARRLKMGIKASDQLVKLPILRYGISDISEDCKDLSLDVLATDNLIDELANEKMVLSYQNEELTDLAKNLVYFQRKMATIMEDLNKEYEIFIKTGKIDQDSVNFLSNELKLAESRKSAYLKDYIQCLRTIDNNLNLSKIIINSKHKVFEQVNVVLTTLSISTQSALIDYWDNYSTIIIDEAGQASELTTLIPLQHRIKHAILIGDPNQLPPTIISKVAQDYLYEQSLFKRIQNCRPDIVKMLNVQYRMHPMISQFPRQYFYENKLQDHELMLEKRTRPWHNDPNHRFPPFLFLDVKGQERLNRDRGISLVNEAEVGAIAQIIRSLCFSYPEIIFAYKLGIVTPYRGQVRKLRSHFIHLFGKTILKYIEINTVDSFQGQEKDIIFFSCVRSSSNTRSDQHNHGIGFLADIRRMNVAITRACSSLFVLGDTQTLLSNDSWSSLIQYAREVKCLHKYKWYQYQTDNKAIPVNIYPSQNEMINSLNGGNFNGVNNSNNAFNRTGSGSRPPYQNSNLMGSRSHSQSGFMGSRANSQNSFMNSRVNSQNSAYSQESFSTVDTEEGQEANINTNNNAKNTQNKYYEKYVKGIDKDLLLKDYLKEDSIASSSSSLPTSFKKNDFPSLGSKSKPKDDFPSLGSKSKPKDDFPSLGNGNTAKSTKTVPVSNSTSAWGKKSTSSSLPPSSPWGKSNSSIKSANSTEASLNTTNRTKSNEFKNLLNLVPKSSTTSSTTSTTFKKQGRSNYY
ncbi:P-loop containing nucleoside triphosphate hydrolase protein, partial [Piromyces finnis]